MDEYFHFCEVNDLKKKKKKKNTKMFFKKKFLVNLVNACNDILHSLPPICHDIQYNCSTCNQQICALSPCTQHDHLLLNESFIF